MTTLQDNAVGPACQNELISPARLLLLAPSEPMSRARRSQFYRLPNEMPWSPASTRVGSTRKMEPGMGH